MSELLVREVSCPPGMVEDESSRLWRVGSIVTVSSCRPRRVYMIMREVWWGGLQESKGTNR